MENIIYKKILRKKKLILGFLLLCASSLLHAQVFTLKQVLDSIQTNNPGLQQFALNAAANNAEGAAAKGWAPPTVGAGLSEFPYGSVNTGNGMMPRKMLMLRLQQMFPNFSKQNKEKAYDESLGKLDKDDSATMKNELFAEAKLAYYDAYVADKKLAVVHQQEKQMKLLLDIFQGRLQYDKAKLPDVYKARAKLSDFQSLEIQLQSVAQQSVVVLNSLMNQPQEVAFEVDTTENFEQLPPQLLAVDSSYILSNRSDIRRFSDNIHSLHLNKEMVTQQSKPTFGISWDNMRMNGNQYMYSAMATLSSPIAPWFSKGYHAKAKAIDYRIQAMQKMQDNQLSQALGNIHKDRLKLLAAEKDINIFKDEVIPAYAKTYQSYMNAFSENTGNVYETLDAWNELTGKQLEYWNKVSNLLNIRVILETELQQP